MENRENLMQDASYSTISSARLNDLIDSISEARRTLEDWQNQKTEAMIRLDSFSYDIAKIEEDRNRMLQQHEDARREVERQGRIHQEQVESLTDRLQVMKFELEELRGSCAEKDLLIEAQRKEIGNLERLRDQQESRHAAILAEQEALFEKRHQEALAREKRIQENLGAQLAEMTQRKVDADARVEKLEQEFSEVRARMMGILHPRKDDPAGAGEDRGAREADHRSVETHTIHELSKTDHSVNDYLKRLGY